MRLTVPLLGAMILMLSACGHSSQKAATQSGSISSDVHDEVPGENRLIVPGVSIGNIHFRESRSAVERALGPGKRIAPDYFSYLGGRLRIGYSYHDGYTGRAQALVTRWSGYRTLSGIHVGSTRQSLKGLHVNCFNGMCASPQNPDYPGIIFTMRHGRVVEIFVGAS
jgi:hypothetical protein